MKVWMRREDEADRDGHFEAEVIAVLYHNGKRLYAVTANIDDAPWYGLVRKDSTSLIFEDNLDELEEPHS